MFFSEHSRFVLFTVGVKWVRFGNFFVFGIMRSATLWHLGKAVKITGITAKMRLPGR
jgi:hypothetical protein